MCIGGGDNSGVALISYTGHGVLLQFGWPNAHTVIECDLASNGAIVVPIWGTCYRDRITGIPVRIIARKTLMEFCARPGCHDAAEPLRAWYALASRADWKSPAEVKTQFRSANFLRDNRCVFNIAGNKYRLVVKFNYPLSIGFVRFIGTHAEYDRIDAGTI